MRLKSHSDVAVAIPTYAPSPTPNTVRAADDKILTVPEGWVLLPPGDAGLTRQGKAEGDRWVVQAKVAGGSSPKAVGDRQQPSSGCWRNSKPSDPPRATPGSRSPLPGVVERCRPDTSRISTGPSWPSTRPKPTWPIGWHG